MSVSPPAAAPVMTIWGWHSEALEDLDLGVLQKIKAAIPPDAESVTVGHRTKDALRPVEITRTALDAALALVQWYSPRQVRLAMRGWRVLNALADRIPGATLGITVGRDQERMREALDLLLQDDRPQE